MIDNIKHIRLSHRECYVYNTLSITINQPFQSFDRVYNLLKAVTCQMRVNA